MKYFRVAIALFCSALTLFGCASLPETSAGKAETLIDRAGIDVIAADAGRHVTYFKEKGATERFCSAPEPDFSRTASNGISVGIPTIAGGTSGVGTSVTQGGLELGGRDPAVLISRELMYRACELSANINADPATELMIYNKFLSILVEVAKLQTGAGSQAVGSEPSQMSPITVTPNPKRRTSSDKDLDKIDLDSDD